MASAAVPTIHLLGSEGFIGRAIQREARDVDLHCWSHRLENPDHHFDLLDPSTWQALLSKRPTHVILLSWPGLPHYQESFHVKRNLPISIDLVENLIASGLQKLVVAGTCYEYGLLNGPLREDQATDPVNCYAVAKDALRRIIAAYCDKKCVQWCWARLFYPYGQGQNPNSLLPSLQHALESGQLVFPMSSGRQIRDYIKVEHIAILLLRLMRHPMACGIYNCGSGLPLSLRELAEMHIQKSQSQIRLDLGIYPDRTDEPLAFWANVDKINALQETE